jgi:hypothetical protein
VTRRAALGGLLVLATAHSAVAQGLTEVRLDAGYASVRQFTYDPTDPVASVDAALIALFVRKPTERWTFLGSGNVTYTRDSLAAAQGVAAFAFPWERSPNLRTDLGAAAASFSLNSTDRGGNGSGFVRQHYVRDQWGTWLGATAGATSRDEVFRRAYAGDAGAWARWRFLYGSASFSRAGSTDFALLFTSGATRSPFAKWYEIEDAQVVLEARNGPHLLSASWTTRRAVAGASLHSKALSARLSVQLTDRVAFLAGAGRQLFDPIRGLPEADILSASIRVTLGPLIAPVFQRSPLAEASVSRIAGGGGRLEVRVFASDTSTVEVAGDFSAWLPLEIVREGSFWVARVDLPSGKYHVGVRLGDGPWRAPRNVARVRDDFGGESGLVVIP